MLLNVPGVYTVISCKLWLYIFSRKERNSKKFAQVFQISTCLEMLFPITFSTNHRKIQRDKMYLIFR